MRTTIWLTAALASMAAAAPSSSVDGGAAAGAMINFPKQPALKEQDRDGQEEQGAGGGSIGGLFGGARGSLECHSCDAGNCEEEEDVEIHGEVDVVPRYCENAIRCYTAHVRDADGVEHKSKGCVMDHFKLSFYCFVNKYDGRHTHNTHDESGQYAVDCCNESRCNNETVWPELPPVPNDEVAAADDLNSGDGSDDSKLMQRLIAILSPIAVMCVLFVLVLSYLKRSHKKRMARFSSGGSSPGGQFNGQNGQNDDMMALRAQAVGDSTLNELLPGEVTSGTGSGMPFLGQRTFAKEIQRIQPIGRGRYGEVWCGVWRGDYVAVKMFLSKEEKTFTREVAIYSEPLFAHENILGFKGSDIISDRTQTLCWLVTQFHRLGSLYDYLNNHSPPAPRAAHKLVVSALRGLNHLHTYFDASVQGKPGIAHRDLKSKNILVRGDGECVIGDFDLAVIQKVEIEVEVMVDGKIQTIIQKGVGGLDMPEVPGDNFKVGTKRYMSPEVLDDSIKKKTSFQAFCNADVYSFALVVWEVLHRTDLPRSSEEAPPHALPYHTCVGPDPSVEEMHQVVCVERKRPEIERRWETDQITNGMRAVMVEMWQSDPSARRGTLNILKKLDGLVSHLPKPEPDFFINAHNSAGPGSFCTPSQSLT